MSRPWPGRDRRRRLRGCAALALGALAALAWSPALAAGSNGPQAIGFHVAGGDDWRWRDEFRLDWTNEPGPEPRAVLYRILDSSGAEIAPYERREGGSPWLDRVQVPKPGSYTIEARLEDGGGELGPPATATLRWDYLPPAAAIPQGPDGWVAGGEAAVVRISHPGSPLPLSGIRGYAVSVDRGEGSSPCALPPACSAEEIDLPGGIGDDTISLGSLPEGVSFVRAVAVSGAGVRSQQVASAAVHVDATVPRTEIGGIPAGWVRGPVSVVASAADPLSGMTPAGPDGPFTAIAVDGGAPSRAPGDTASALVAGEGVHRVTAYARDAAGNVADGAGAAAPTDAVVRIDETPPRVGFASSQDPADPERIEAAVGDELSGASAERGSIEVRPAGSRAAFEPLPTAVRAGRLLARWDSDAYAPGSYEFRATAYDRAGNATTSDRRANGSRMVLGSPLKLPVTIESGFGGATLRWRACRRSNRGTRCRERLLRSFESRPAQVAVAFGHGMRFSGRIASPSGAPLGGADVAIAETFAPGATATRTIAHVKADAEGAFSYRLPPGPSREVVASFAGDRLASAASGAAVRLGVRTAVGLRASTGSARVGGAPVVFSGRVAAAGARLPSTGLPVELQFRYPGAGWSAFRTVQTDARGRFRYPYAFSDDDSRGVRFEFRARVAAVDGWPYDPGSSRPVFVTGR